MKPEVIKKARAVVSLVQTDQQVCNCIGLLRAAGMEQTDVFAALVKASEAIDEFNP